MFLVRDYKDQTNAYLPPLSRHLAVVPSAGVFVLLLRDFHSLLRRTSSPELPPVIMMRCCCRISVEKKTHLNHDIRSNERGILQSSRSNESYVFGTAEASLN